jgi:RHS repeat-associated protein
MTYAYDDLDRVTSMTWANGTPALASWAYTYNPRGQRVTSADVSGREAAYGYDKASRLIGETITGDSGGTAGNGALTYVLDSVGNRVSRTSTLAALSAQTFGVDANDRLTSDVYDANGNTTASAGHTFAYDFERRMVSKDGGAVTFVYDGDGNRVARTSGGVTTQYLVDELNPTGYSQVVDELSSGAVQIRYTYGNKLVSEAIDASAASKAAFYGYDGHGNIAFLTDATGAQTDTYVYDAWGNLIGKNGSTPNTRLYAGEEFDADLGLVNLRARQYDPATGRFWTGDPVDQSDRQSLVQNRYLFGDGDPVDRYDPSGRASAVEYVIAVLLPSTIAALAAGGVIGSGSAFQKWCLVGAGFVGSNVTFAAAFVGAAAGGAGLIVIGLVGMCYVADAIGHFQYPMPPFPPPQPRDDGPQLAGFD